MNPAVERTTRDGGGPRPARALGGLPLATSLRRMRGMGAPPVLLVGVRSLPLPLSLSRERVHFLSRSLYLSLPLLRARAISFPLSLALHAGNWPGNMFS